MEHTLGPWTLFAREKVVEVQDANGKPVVTWAGFDDSRRPLKVRKANGRLIAAAPDLLAVCQEVVDSAYEPVELDCRYCGAEQYGDRLYDHDHDCLVTLAEAAIKRATKAVQ